MITYKKNKNKRYVFRKKNGFYFALSPEELLVLEDILKEIKQDNNKED